MGINFIKLEGIWMHKDQIVLMMPQLVNHKKHHVLFVVRNCEKPIVGLKPYDSLKKCQERISRIMKTIIIGDKFYGK